MIEHTATWTSNGGELSLFISKMIKLHIVFSYLVMSNSATPGSPGLSHSRLLCPPLSPRVCSNSCPLSWWRYLIMSSSVMPFSFCLQSFPALGSFSNESILRIRWPKYQSFSFSFSNSPSNEYSGLISSRIDWFDLLAVQGTLMSLLQHHSSKALILWSPAFFTVQLSHPYTTTGKTIALTVQTFVGKVILFTLLIRAVWLTMLHYI